MEKQKRTTVDVSFESIIRFFLVCFIIYFIYYIKDILFLVFISVLIALTAEPFVNKAEKKWGMPRVFGAGSIFGLGALFLIILLYIVTPPLAKELGQLANNVPSYLNSMDFQYLISNGNELGFTPSDFQNILSDLSNSLKNATYFVFNQAMGVVGGILSLVLIAVMSFYLVLEKDGIEKFVKILSPDKYRTQSVRITRKIEKKMGSWFLGQLTLGLIIGVTTFIGLYLIGVPYALVLAILAGILELVPYIGPILSSIPAVIIAFTISPTIAAATFVFYFLLQQLEGYLIVPKVMEKSVGLHPIIIIIVAILGQKMAGIPGMILAVPVATIVFLIMEDIKQNKGKC